MLYFKKIKGKFFNSEKDNFMKAKSIVLKTEYTGEIIDAKISDEGKVVIRDFEFDLEKAKPIIIESKGGRLRKARNIPYFLMKQSTILPFISEMKHEDIKFNMNCPKCGTTVCTYPAKKTTIEPLDDKTYQTMLTPKMLKETADMRFLKQMKKYAEGGKKMEFNKGIILRLLIAIVAGLGVTYLLYTMGIFKF
jgi:hypothetical protein